MPHGGGVFFLEELGTRSEQTSAILSESIRACLSELLDIWTYGNKSICCFRYPLQSERSDCMHGGQRDESLEVTLMPGVRAEAIATNFC